MAVNIPPRVRIREWFLMQLVRNDLLSYLQNIIFEPVLKRLVTANMVGMASCCWTCSWSRPHYAL